MRRAILGLALLALFVLAPPASAWTWPLHGDVLRPYSLGPDPYAAGQHRGVDVGGAAGEPVRAPASGTVSFAGVVPGSGRTVTIQLEGYAVSLTHLGEITVPKGAVVTEGDPVGLAGASGDAEWPTPYVHLGIRVSAAADGYLDPADAAPAAHCAAAPADGAEPSPGARTVAGRGHHAPSSRRRRPRRRRRERARRRPRRHRPRHLSLRLRQRPRQQAASLCRRAWARARRRPGPRAGHRCRHPHRRLRPARPCGWARWRRRRASLRGGRHGSTVNGSTVSGSAAAHARIRRGSGRYRPVAPTGGGPSDRRRSR